jgi:putative ABC transport system substrate-binding protein
LLVLNASDQSELEAAFATLVEQRAGAVAVGSDDFFLRTTDQLLTLAARYRIPAIYVGRQYAVAGGLMSYGPKTDDMFRQLGVYAGRILEGENPADLPVQQPTKFEFVINLKTAKALGLTIPETLLATADEVIQ